MQTHTHTFHRFFPNSYRDASRTHANIYIHAQTHTIHMFFSILGLTSSCMVESYQDTTPTNTYIYIQTHTFHRFFLTLGLTNSCMLDSYEDAVNLKRDITKANISTFLISRQDGRYVYVSAFFFVYACTKCVYVYTCIYTCCLGTVLISKQDGRYVSPSFLFILESMIFIIHWKQCAILDNTYIHTYMHTYIHKEREWSLLYIENNVPS
jgi:hypothetical protein